MSPWSQRRRTQPARSSVAADSDTCCWVAAFRSLGLGAGTEAPRIRPDSGATRHGVR